MQKTSAKNVNINEFQYVQGRTFLSTPHETAAAITLYYAVVYGSQWLLRDTRPFALKPFSQLHNLLLSTLSLILLILMLEQCLPIVFSHGIRFAICDEHAWTQPLEFLYYVNYLVKYLEFLDTLFLVFKHKKLRFLHVYHHGATALLCFFQLNGKTSVSWVPITLNLFVHVLMYWYYFLCSRNIKVPWKHWITRLQILQFILDLVAVYYVAIQDYFSSKENILANWIICDKCAGTRTAINSGCLILSSYLILFIMFYFEVYRTRKPAYMKVEKAQ